MENVNSLPSSSQKCSEFLKLTDNKAFHIVILKLYYLYPKFVLNKIVFRKFKKKGFIKTQSIRSTDISRKVVGENVHATIPKGNMGYNQYTVPEHCSCRWIYFCCFLLAPSNIRQWPLESFFQTSLKNSEFKTTHNTFRDCRLRFFRQPFFKIAVCEGCRKALSIIASNGSVPYL